MVYTKHMQDSVGNDLKDGQTVERVVAGRVTPVGYQSTIVVRKWNESDTSESIVADGGFIQEKLSPARAKEFKVINQ